MTTKEFDLLSKVFAADFGEIPLAQIGKSKLVKKLEDEGLIVAAETTLPGRFPVLIKGHIFTMKGYFIYCQECEKREPESI